MLVINNGTVVTMDDDRVLPRRRELTTPACSARVISR